MQCMHMLFSPPPPPPKLFKARPVLQPRCKAQKVTRSPSNGDGGVEIIPSMGVSLPPNLTAITSTSNPFVKHCVKLRQSSSYRHLHGSVIVIGATPITEILSLERTQTTVNCLFVLENCGIPEAVDHDATHIVKVNSQVIRKLSGVQSDDSIQLIALMQIPSSFHIVDTTLEDQDCHMLFPAAHRILVLEGIQDPGNMGALLRSATAFRWDGVFLLPGCCDPFNDKALRASRGSCFRIPIVSGSWTHLETIRRAFRMRTLAGHPETSHACSPVATLSKDLADSVAGSPLCLVLGSEGRGISELACEVCELVAIPMPGEFESLNVAVAGGIFMYMLQNQMGVC